MLRYQSQPFRRAVQDNARTWVVEENGIAQRHPPGLGNTSGEEATQDPLINADKEIGYVALEVVHRSRPVLRGAPDLGFQTFGGVQRPTAWNAGAAIGDERFIEPCRDTVVEQVVDDAVSEIRRPHLSRLGSGDDETGRRSRAIAAVLKLVVQP